MITKLRNHLYDIGYTKSFEFDRVVVAIGNLSVGGTGKTPMVEYLIRLLKSKHSVSTLSRGYGRKTRGFKMATADDSATSIGDEPYQIHLKYGSEVKVAVGEERALAISSMLLDHPEIEVILLDDAFQHRTVRPGLNILLTSFDRPFYQDHLLPMGRLREARSGAARADIIVVTKCPQELDLPMLNDTKEAIIKYAPKVPVFFSRIKYANPKPLFAQNSSECSDHVILVSGIAFSQQLEEYVIQQFKLIRHLKYKDHHHYSAQDLMRIKDIYDQNTQTSVSVLTTEKDMVKWLNEPLQQIIKELPVFYLPMEMTFVEEGERFNQKVLNSFDYRGDNAS